MGIPQKEALDALGEVVATDLDQRPVVRRVPVERLDSATLDETTYEPDAASVRDEQGGPAVKGDVAQARKDATLLLDEAFAAGKAERLRVFAIPTPRFGL